MEHIPFVDRYSSPNVHANPGEPVCQKQTLEHIWLEVTERCNLACTHCYNHSGPKKPLRKHMNDNDWLKVLYEARDFGCASVQFIGGEATLHPGLEYMLACARELGYNNVEVFTNGTALTEQRVRRFGELQTRLACSFYSVDAHVHDRITQKRGSFYKTVEGLRRAVSHGLEIRVGVVQISQSDKEIDDALAFLRELGVGTVRTDQVRAIGRAAVQNGMERDDPDEFPDDEGAFQDLCGACGERKLCVTSQGDVLPCIMSRRWRVGRVDEGIRSVMQGDPLQKFLSLKRSHTPETSCQCHPNTCSPNCNPNACYPNCSPM